MSVIDFELPCAACQGSLYGAPLAGACPHCGADLGETLNREALLPQALTVADDVPCINCEYNLRTLVLRGHCPECGVPVADSLKPDELRFADLNWLKRVRRGTTMLLVGILGGIGAWGLLMVSAMLSYSAAVLFMTVAGIAIFVTFIVALLGVDRVTRRDPHPRTPRLYLTAGHVVRWSCVAVFVLWLGGVWTAGVVSGWALVIAALLVLLVCVGVVGGSALCLRHVAVRGRRPGLRQLTHVVIGLAVALGAVSAVAFALVGLSMGSMMGGAMMVTPYAGGAALPYATIAGTNGLADTSGVPAPVWTASPPPAAPPPLPPGWAGGLNAVGAGIGSCAGLCLAPLMLLLAVVALFMYRGLLSAAIAGSPGERSRAEWRA